jgi:hypothetical protein
LKNISQHRYSKSAVAVMVSAVLASGCATNPYVMTEGLKTSLNTKKNNTTQYVPEQAKLDNSSYGGDLEQAISDVDAQRNAYMDAVVNRTNQRNLLSAGLITLTAAALYKGVNAADGGSSRAVANLGAVAGGAYALNSYSNSPNTELAYLNAANDLTCLILKTRPWLVKEADFQKFKTSIETLSTAINALDKAFQAQAAQSGNTKAYVRNHPFEMKMLYNARVTLRKAHNFHGYVTSAGFHLRQEAILVANNTHLEIHRLQPDLVNPSMALSGLRSTSQAFREIKPLDVPSADSQKEPADEGVGSMSNNSSGETKTGKPPSANEGNNGKSDETTANSDMGRAADKLNDLVQEQTKLLQQYKKTAATESQKTKAEIDALNKKLMGVSKAIADIKEGKKTDVQLMVPQLTATDAKDLAIKLSNLLEKMREINTTLTRAYSLKPYVKNIAQCQRNPADDFGFTFEDDTVQLFPGQSFEVAVKGGVGVPQIWLSGAKSSSQDERPTFTTSIDGGIPRAKLELKPKTPPGDLYIMAVDGSGKRQDQMKITVLEPKR